MPTMRPVVLLVGFCATMTAIAVGRLVVDDYTPVDLGTALIVLGITFLSTLWAAVTEARASTAGRLLLAVAGIGCVGAGLLVIARHWETTVNAETKPTRESGNGERDGT